MSRDGESKRSQGSPRSRRAIGRIVVGSTREGIRRTDPRELAAVLFAIPALLVGVHLGPGTGNWALSLAASGILESRWTLWTAFASSFVHADAAHLLNNVAVYWLLVGVAYPLSVVAGWRRHLLAVTGFSLLIVPLLGSWITVVALGAHTDVPASGFSGVNNALLAYLLVVWFAALDRTTDGAVDRRWAAALFPATLTVVLAVPATVVYFPRFPVAALLFALISLGTGVVLLRVTGRPHVPRLAADREFLFVVGASVFAAGLIGSLLYVPLGSNVYAHLAGYVVGGCTSLGTGVLLADT